MMLTAIEAKTNDNRVHDRMNNTGELLANSRNLNIVFPPNRKVD